MSGRKISFRQCKGKSGLPRKLKNIFPLPIFLLCWFLFPRMLEAAQAAPADGGLSVSSAIFWAFWGGLALDLTPCVYPLIPITISFFSAKPATRIGGSPASTSINALLYILGIALMNSLLGVFAALSGRLLGTVLQNPITLIAVALVMVIFALSLFDLWELRLPSFLTGAAARHYVGYFGSFAMGLTLGIVAAPCIGPFVAGILLLVAKTGNPLFGFWVFFSLSMGMGLPLFALAILSGRLTMLPKPGEWMIWVRKAMGWVLIGAAAYFLVPVLPEALGIGFLCLIALSAGIHLGWIESTGFQSGVFGLARKSVAIFCFGIAGWLIWTAMPSGGVVWTPFSDSTLAKAKDSGKPVIIDFYADWCAPCRYLEKLTFHDRSVVEAAARDFIMIRVDITRGGEKSKEKLASRYDVRGVPTVIFLKPGGEEREDLRVMHPLPASEFLARMNELKKKDK